MLGYMSPAVVPDAVRCTRTSIAYMERTKIQWLVKQTSRGKQEVGESSAASDLLSHTSCQFKLLWSLANRIALIQLASVLEPHLRDSADKKFLHKYDSLIFFHYFVDSFFLE